MFKTTGVVNKDFVNEIRRYLLPTYVKVVMALFPLLFLPFFSYRSVVHIVCNIFVLCLMFVAVVGAYVMRMNKLVKLQLDRIFESTGTYEVEYTVFFEEDGIVIQNHSTGANIKTKYDVMRKLVKCKSYYVLFTASRQYVPIFVECLSDTEKEELIAFLKSHAPALK